MRAITLSSLVAILAVVPPIGSQGPDADAVERGELLYRLHCQTCHGVLARGDGPMASVLRTTPPDLTLLERRHGSFDRAAVESAIDGRSEIPVHGSREMPVWGLSLTDLGSDVNREEAITERIQDLAAFLETLQR